MLLLLQLLMLVGSTSVVEDVFIHLLTSVALLREQWVLIVT